MAFHENILANVLDPAVLAAISIAFPDLAKVLGSKPAQLIAGSAAAEDYRRREDEALAQLEGVTQEGRDILSDLGIGTPSVLNPDSPKYDKEVAQLVGAFEGGFVPPEGALEHVKESFAIWQEQGVAGLTGQTVIGQSQAAAQEGIARGDRFFDPSRQEARFAKTIRPISAGFEAVPGQVAAGNQAVQGLFGGLRGEFATGAADINRRFGESLTTARGLVSSLGGQERADINRSFTEAGTRLQTDLSRRGLGSSTIRGSIGTGIERERTDALGRLQDRLTRQQLGVEQTFGLGGLSARERLLGGGINLGAQQGQAMQFGNQLFANTAISSLANRGNLALGRLDAFNQAAINNVNNFANFSQIPVQTALQASQQGLNYLTGLPVAFPSPPR